MKTIAEIRTADLDHDSQSTAVEAARAILDKQNLSTKTHAMATEVEGEVDDVLEAIKQIHAQLHAAGHARLSTTLTMETRSDDTPSLSR